MPRYKVSTLLDGQTIDWYVVASDPQHAKSKALSDSVYVMTILPLISEEFFEKDMSPLDALIVLEVKEFPPDYNKVPDWIWKLK